MYTFCMSINVCFHPIFDQYIASTRITTTAAANNKFIASICMCVCMYVFTSVDSERIKPNMNVNQKIKQLTFNMV